MAADLCGPLKEVVQPREGKPGRQGWGYEHEYAATDLMPPPAWAHEEGVVATVRKVPRLITMSLMMLDCVLVVRRL